MKQHYDFSKTRSIKLTRLLQRISKSEADRQSESNKRELLELLHKQLKEDAEHVS
jgi:predicted kinase